jgi:hypothetical protein
MDPSLRSGGQTGAVHPQRSEESIRMSAFDCRSGFFASLRMTERIWLSESSKKPATVLFKTIEQTQPAPILWASHWRKFAEISG